MALLGWIPSNVKFYQRRDNLVCLRMKVVRVDNMVYVPCHQTLCQVRYVDDSNNVTQEYPFNPNGSPELRHCALRMVDIL